MFLYNNNIKSYESSLKMVRLSGGNKIQLIDNITPHK